MPPAVFAAGLRYSQRLPPLVVPMEPGFSVSVNSTPLGSDSSRVNDSLAGSMLLIGTMRACSSIESRRGAFANLILLRHGCLHGRVIGCGISCACADGAPSSATKPSAARATARVLVLVEIFLMASSTLLAPQAAAAPVRYRRWYTAT